MSRVKNRDTAPELSLRRALFAAGVRGWRRRPSKVFGHPDLAFARHKLAVFVDGAFSHGHPDYYSGQSDPFWDEEIACNRARDERVNARLDAAGWRVLRFWDFEVERELHACVERVKALV
jgi:DNA mismatch endonuclease, patch repair protein